MEIKTIGYSKKLVKPDTILIYFQFEKKANTYETVLNLGIKQVNQTIQILESLGFQKKDLKTNQFNINKIKMYNENTKEYYDEYHFYQTTELKFPLDINLLDKILKALGTIDAPNYNIEASLEQSKIYERELLEGAFSDAEQKARILATANEKELKECIKIKELDEYQIQPVMLKSESNYSIQYTPNDIVLEKKIVGEWNTKKL